MSEIINEKSKAIDNTTPETSESIEKLTSEQYKAIAAAVIKIYEEQKVHDIEQDVDTRMNNVLLLLRNYRKFKIYTKNAIFNVKKANIILAESLCDMNSLKDELKIESIIRTRERTIVMIAHIDKMMKIYKNICAESEDPADHRKFQVIYRYYIKPEKERYTDICADLFIESSTFYDDIKKACEDLGPLLFGVAGL